MIKVGIIGIGAISNSHIPSWMNVKEAKIVALCDIRPEQMEKWKGKLDANFYTDCDEMLKNEELDVLDICLPTYLHTEYAMKGFSQYQMLCPIKWTFKNVIAHFISKVSSSSINSL